MTIIADGIPTRFRDMDGTESTLGGHRAAWL